MRTAADLMTREVFTLPARLSLAGAAWALAHRGLSGAPVRDADGTLLGMLSETELLEARFGGDAAVVDEGLDDLAGARAGDDDRTIADILTPALLAVAPDDPIGEVVALMIAHRAHRIVVLDDEGELLGIIATIDVVRAAAAGAIAPDVALGAGAPAPAP